jgi:hypothetical protein
VWYVHVHHRWNRAGEWLIRPVWDMIGDAVRRLNGGEITADQAADLPIFKLTPFIETMGRIRREGRRREFWWEREWRHVGDFQFSRVIGQAVVLAPASDHAALRAAIQSSWPGNMRLVDVTWSDDQIDGVLVGLDNGPFPPD